MYWLPTHYMQDVPILAASPLHMCASSAGCTASPQHKCASHVLTTIPQLCFTNRMYQLPAHTRCTDRQPSQLLSPQVVIPPALCEFCLHQQVAPVAVSHTSSLCHQDVLIARPYCLHQQGMLIASLKLSSCSPFGTDLPAWNATLLASRMYCVPA